MKYWTRHGPVDAWEVAALEPDRFLGLRGLRDREAASSTRSSHGHLAYTEGLWAFLLNELPGDRTRLVISGYQTLRPRWLERFADYWLYVPVVWRCRPACWPYSNGTSSERPRHERGSSPLRRGRLAILGR